MQLFGQNKWTSKKAYMHMRANGINNQVEPTIELSYWKYFSNLQETMIKGENM